ncbi:acyltransferase family protein [Curtobacterium sp. MCBD17_040]|nr:acyltransferase family protein [Curtobacterium sp. MCBD17_040]WIB65216.1 acyltransferase family protein [Curtobacterium sp. MCBD17_040]
MQGLRAVAVTSVVLYHLWPNRLPGGYVGVDVFFAISGFLIIGHVLREVERTNRLDVLAFWARRARRLLPASMLVLVATGVATILWVPQVLWLQYLKEISASAVYVQNWVLSANSVDYLAAGNSASPVQHFWSLSVEEQFYIVWPLIILGVLALRRWRRNLQVKRVLFLLIVMVSLASFVYCIVDTAASPASAYFVTTTRAWEFGAGGILAFITAHRRKPRRHIAATMSWTGIAIVALTLVVFTPATPFPSYTALLPVVGTLLVIAAGTPHIWWSPTQVARLRPVQWLGAISYSLYLWHFPLLTILPLELKHPLGTKSKIAVIVVAVLLAVLTKRFVEDPGRTWKVLVNRRPLITIGATVAVTVLVLSGGGVATIATNHSIAAQAAEARAELAKLKSCAGARAIESLSTCPDPFTPNTLTDPAFAATDIGKGVATVDPCKQGLTQTAVMTCRIGDTTAPTRIVALVGDSHAGQLLEPLDIYGAAHGIEFVTYLKSFCAGLGAPGVAAAGNGVRADVDSCAAWGVSVQHDILANTRIQSVVFADFTQSYASTGAPWRPATATDFENVWRPLLASGKGVIAIRDTPNAAQIDVPQCVAQHISDVDPCSTPLAEAEPAPAANPMLVAAAAMPEVKTVDLTSLFCTGATCHSVIGGLVVYFGWHHMDATFARTTAPYVGAAIDALVPTRS